MSPVSTPRPVCHIYIHKMTSTIVLVYYYYSSRHPCRGRLICYDLPIEGHIFMSIYMYAYIGCELVCMRVCMCIHRESMYVYIQRERVLHVYTHMRRVWKILCVCVCVCVCIHRYTHTHSLSLSLTHTHTHISC